MKNSTSSDKNKLVLKELIGKDYSGSSYLIDKNGCCIVQTTPKHSIFSIRDFLKVYF